ncbi:uncharacterized protein LOC144123921 [Amblyomma americanum]
MLDLPMDGRTLLRTPRKPQEQCPVTPLAPGHYCHFGLADGLLRLLRPVENPPALIPLSFNIDGLPLSKSSKMQLWPIQCLAHDCGDETPFLVGAFAGKSKPDSSNEFLRPFVSELRTLVSEGLIFNGKVLHVIMAYAIVEFLHHEEVEVVPLSWIDDRKCAWPDHAKGDRIVSLVRKAAPPDSSWKQFDNAVKGLFGAYELARRKLDKSQYTSELSSDGEPPQKRRYPTHLRQKCHTGKMCHRCPMIFLKVIVCWHEGEARLSDRRDSVDEDFKQHVIRLLNILHFTQQQHGDMLNKLCEVLPSQAIITKPLLISEPFTSVDDLLKFNEKLDKENFALLVRELVQLGGKNSNVAAKRMLAYVLSDQLATKFSWVGRKNKLNFSALKMSNAIIAAAAEFLQGSMANIEDSIKSWLRHAPERLFGSQRRKKSASSADPSEDGN